MSHAEKCPVCNGKGKVKDDQKLTADALKTCYGCQGMGWVTVQDSHPWNWSRACDPKSTNRQSKHRL